MKCHVIATTYSILILAFCLHFRSKEIIQRILDAKLKEIEVGVDGFMVYDSRVVKHVNQVCNKTFHQIQGRKYVIEVRSYINMWEEYSHENTFAPLTNISAGGR